MSTCKIDVKLPTLDGTHPPLAELVPVFHGWIQQRRIADELLIDVANYAHVTDGPGVMLIGHEGHYGLDLGDGGPGLLYSQRRPREDMDLAQALERALRQALGACALLESETGFATPLRFRTDRWLVRVNDRLHAPNTPETWERMREDCHRVLQRHLGQDLKLEPVAPGRGLFGFHVQTGARLDARSLLARLS